MCSTDESPACASKAAPIRATWVTPVSLANAAVQIVNPLSRANSRAPWGSALAAPSMSPPVVENVFCAFPRASVARCWRNSGAHSLDASRAARSSHPASASWKRCRSSSMIARLNIATRELGSFATACSMASSAARPLSASPRALKRTKYATARSLNSPADVSCAVEVETSCSMMASRRGGAGYDARSATAAAHPASEPRAFSIARPTFAATLGGIDPPVQRSADAGSVAHDDQPVDPDRRSL